MKWRWKLLQRSETGLWKEVLVAKNGAHILNNVSWLNVFNPYFASVWWKDICDLETYVESKIWVVEAVTCSLDNGMWFWSDVWIEDSNLCSKFPPLFSLSLQKDACVSGVVVREMRRCRGIWFGDEDFFSGRRTPFTNLWPRLFVSASPMLRIGGGGLLTPMGASQLKVRMSQFLRS
ncbi:unnamed protein product [Trifolium pratense]|uniref:Uncharacterized protein n=1 Tax=Trifolium pratense TaxID=57577 RepID=A0ACB0LUJ7_TRIPR|nr:unnamed protein product [Trifolium pratense]